MAKKKAQKETEQIDSSLINDKFDALVNLLKNKYKKTNTQVGTGHEIAALVNLKGFISSGSYFVDKDLGGGFARGRIHEIYGPESSGKAQPLSAKVLTPTGWSTIGELEVGDIICAPDGTNTTVIGLYPQGEQDIYEVVLDDGSKTRCTADHLWQVCSRTQDLEEVMTTQELLDAGLCSKRNTKNSIVRKWKIPITKPLQFNKESELPIDPYFFGLLLGDGSFRNATIKFSTKDDELLDRIGDILQTKYSNMKVSKKSGDCDYRLTKITRTSEKSELANQLQALGLMNLKSSEKFIPEQYKFASLEQRTALLQGLMDTDGSVDSNGSISFSTSSKKLSDDFVFLARSLGWRCTTSSRQTKYPSPTGEYVDGLPSYRSSIIRTNDISPVLLTRKKKNLCDDMSTFRFRFIDSIELIGREEAQCIKVSHPDELYITDDFIVTHNTTLCISAIKAAQKDYPELFVVFIDAEHALHLEYLENNGIDVNRLLIIRPESAEEAFEAMINCARSETASLIVLDSLAALASKAELKAHEEGGDTRAALPRVVSSKIKILASIAEQTGTAIIIINQIRMKLGVLYGNQIIGNNIYFIYTKSVLANFQLTFILARKHVSTFTAHGLTANQNKKTSILEKVLISKIMDIVI